jgi:uncharacterized protein (DUF58 family)
MTSWSRQLALIGLIGLIVGVTLGQMSVAILCLAWLLWMLWEWVQFSICSERELGRLQLERSINGRSDATGVLWAGRTLDIRVRIFCKSTQVFPDRIFRDVVPENLEIISSTIPSSTHSAINSSSRLRQQIGRWASVFKIVDEICPNNQVAVRTPQHEVEINYTARVRAAGEVVFPGIRMEFHDPRKFFRLDRFMALRQTFRVLPSFTESADASPLLKRMNAIPRHGIHRQQRPGIGFELLELREYVDGDPPKTIAWKASARRDKLMTRQYESEVPVRVQLILDGTASTRMGGFGHRLIDQMTHVGASVAHSVISAGDAIGCYLIEEEATKRTIAASGTIGFYSQLRAMGAFSVNRSPGTALFSLRMLETAYAVCSERYPELLDPQVNPFSLVPFALFSTQRGRQRIQLAAVMAELYNLSITTQVEMVLDENELAKYLLKFLCESGMPWMAPIVSISDVAIQHSPVRVRLVTQALTAAISHAHDNEVFVLVADLLGDTASMDELLSAIRIAKSKHHRVAVICPSPTLHRPKSKSSTVSAKTVAAKTVAELRLLAEGIRLGELALPLKRSLTKLGVPMSIAGEPKATGLVLSEIAIAKSGRMTTQGSTR